MKPVEWAACVILGLALVALVSWLYSLDADACAKRGGHVVHLYDPSGRYSQGCVEP